MEKISRLWTTHEIFTARGNKMCDRFEDTSVIRTIARHHIYKNTLSPPLERHPRAEKNPTMTNAVAIIENDS